MPYTMEGMPARLAMLILIRLVRRLRGAYSSRYTAAAMAIGMAMTAVSRMIHTLPTMAGRMPDLEAKREGKF